MRFSERPLDSAVLSTRAIPRPQRVALLANPQNRTGPTDAQSLSQLVRNLRIEDIRLTSPDDDGGARALAEWAESGIDTVAVLGGDGTLRRVAASLHRLGLDHAVRLMLLDGGSLGLVAGALGASDAWERVATATGPNALRFDPVALPTLRVGDALGFVAGFGLPAAVSRDFQARRLTRAGVLPYALLSAARLAVGGSREVLAGYDGSVDLGVHRFERGSVMGCFVTAIPELSLIWGVVCPEGSGPLFTVSALRRRSRSGVELRAIATQAVVADPYEPSDQLVDGDLTRSECRLTITAGPIFGGFVPMPAADVGPGRVW